MAAALRKLEKTQVVEEVPEIRRRPRTDPRRLKAFSERLNLMLAELGLPERGRARVIKDRMGVSGTTAANWLRGDSYPSFEELERVGRLGLDPLRLLSNSKDVIPSTVKANPSAAAESQGLARLMETNQLLPLTSLQTSDGEWDHTALPNHIWQQFLGRDVRGFVLLFMKGDAMGERIKDGTPLLIDTNVTQVTEDNGIYGLLVGENVIVRRVHRRLQGDYLITCDNPAIAAETLTSLGTHHEAPAKAGEVLVLGRVALAMQKV